MIRTLVVALIFWLYCHQIQCIPQERFGKPYGGRVKVNRASQMIATKREEISGPHFGDEEQNLVKYLRDEIQGRFGDEKTNLDNLDKSLGPHLGDEETKVAKHSMDKIQGRFGDEKTNLDNLDKRLGPHLGDEETKMAKRLMDKIQGRFGDGELNVEQDLNA